MRGGASAVFNAQSARYRNETSQGANGGYAAQGASAAIGLLLSSELREAMVRCLEQETRRLSL
jgi:hypothetical protein